MTPRQHPTLAPETQAPDWAAVRAQFALTPEYLHLGASQFIASHPRPVREAIAHYRRVLDENPVLCTQELENSEMQRVREAAARYLGLDEPDYIAMTDSTTMGLGTIYSGLNLQPGQEVLTTVHDHYSQHEAIQLATRRSGGSYRKVAMYARIERETFPELGCDFFIAGCHKWLYGPRGTGLVAATRAAWQTVAPVIPTFTDAMNIITEEAERPDHMDGKQMTPGGFHSLEYRWALRAAFEFMESLGRAAVCERVHQLNRQCKEGLAAMPHVVLHTPLSDDLSAGITSFEVRGYNTDEVVERLQAQKIIATKAPYQYFQYARFTPGIINTPEEVDRALAAVRRLG